MTTQEATKKAIEALKNEAMNEQIMWERNIAFLQLEEIGVELGAKMDVVKEAMEKQISIKKVIERLEEMEGTCNGHKCGKDGCAGCVDCKIEKAYAEAIAIIKEEVG